jgi:hypothetical protein
MNFLKGWPFEPLTGIQDNQLCGGGDSGGGSPG